MKTPPKSEFGYLCPLDEALTRMAAPTVNTQWLAEQTETLRRFAEEEEASAAAEAVMESVGLVMSTKPCEGAEYSRRLREWNDMLAPMVQKLKDEKGVL